MGYKILPNNKFFHAARNIVEKETVTKPTVRFNYLVDLTEIEEIRDKYNDMGKRKPSYATFVCKAVGLALKEFPYANRKIYKRPWLFFLGPRLLQFDRSDIAVAVERKGDIEGVEHITFINILRDADQLSIDEISQFLYNLTNSDASNNKQWKEFSKLITSLPSWLSYFLIRLPVWFPSLWIKYRGGSVLLSSPAKYGVDILSANWSSPLAISYGLVKKRPMVIKDEVVARPSFHFLMNFDRRVMAGAPAARFFARVCEMLTDAKEELMS